MRAFFTHIRNVIAYNQLPEEQRRLTIYSEGKNYWSYLGGILNTVLERAEFPVCYVSSSPDDPGLAIEHPRLKKFLIGEGFVRDWMFANMQTKVLVTTMPDIGKYQVKRSVHPVHYVYLQHSLVSLHMVYRPGAFDYYDTIFCAGPHHVKEIRALEARSSLPPKAVFEHGYARLDSIQHKAAQRENPPKKADAPLHYLLAPSWGPTSTLETGLGEPIVDLLIEQGAKVTLRPHPQTLKFAQDSLQPILDKYKGHENFAFENNVECQASLHASDIMICDWSGAALDYAFGLGKPVIFIDVERKVNNSKYENIPIEPFEVGIRNVIGTVISPDRLSDILAASPSPLPNDLAQKYVFNVGQSDAVGAAEIIRLVES